MAKTHNAAWVASGDTCDHFAHRYIREGGTAANVIWVDEVSMLDCALLQEFNHLSFKQPPVQWILSGDSNQYLPFFNTFRGAEVTRSFQECELLHALSGGHRITLTECRRSDAFLFEWYASLAEAPMGWRHSRSIQENVAEARATFTEAKATGFMPDSRLAPTNLVLSHQRREAINEACNQCDRRGHVDAQHFTLDGPRGRTAHKTLGSGRGSRSLRAVQDARSSAMAGPMKLSSWGIA